MLISSRRLSIPKSSKPSGWEIEITTDLVPDIHLRKDEDEEDQLARIKASIESSGVVNGAHALD